MWTQAAQEVCRKKEALLETTPPKNRENSCKFPTVSTNTTASANIKWNTHAKYCIQNTENININMKDFNRLWQPANGRTLQQYMQSCQLSAMVNKDFTSQ